MASYKNYSVKCNFWLGKTGQQLRRETTQNLGGAVSHNLQSTDAYLPDSGGTGHFNKRRKFPYVSVNLLQETLLHFPTHARFFREKIELVLKMSKKTRFWSKKRLFGRLFSNFSVWEYSENWIYGIAKVRIWDARIWDFDYIYDKNRSKCLETVLNRFYSALKVRRNFKQKIFATVFRVF